MNSIVENLNRLGGQFLSFAWPMLWQSSLLIAAVFLADILLARKIRASVRHALWLVVLAKLLLPPTLALPTGAAWWLFPAKPVVVLAAKPPVANNYSVVVDDAPLPADYTAEPVPQVEAPRPKLTVAGWMLLASGVISAGLLAWLVFRWGQLAQKVRGAAKALGAAGPINIEEALKQARQRAGLRGETRLKLVEGRMSPAVCGLFRPVILLPRMLVEKLSAAQLQAVLLHEMIHLRRKDIWVNCAQSLLQIFYWWHPLVWVANGRIRRVREEAVDDAVMLGLANDAEAYAPTLLEVAKLAFRRPLMSLGLVGIMESRSALRQRIERLMDFRAPRKAGLTFVSVCGIFVFSAVAVPMGQGPAPVVKEASTASLAATKPTGTGLSNQPTILLTAIFARVPAVQFNYMVSGLSDHQDYVRTNALWTVSPDEFMHPFPILGLFESPSIELLGKPQVLTLNGQEARISIGDGTNELEFDCTSTMDDGLVGLDFRGQVIDGKQTLTTNQFQDHMAAENLGGLLIRLDKPNGLNARYLAGIIGVIVLTNAPVGEGHGSADIWLEAGKVLYDKKRWDQAESDFKNALTENPEDAEAKYYVDTIEARRSKHAAEATRMTLEIRKENTLKLDGTRIPNIRFDGVSLDKVEGKLMDAALKNDPYRNGNIGFSFGNSLELAATNIFVNMPEMINARLADILDAVVRGADKPITYSIDSSPAIIIFSPQGIINQFSADGTGGSVQPDVQTPQADPTGRTTGQTPDLTGTVVQEVATSSPASGEETTNAPQILITGRFYQMSGNDFGRLTSGLQFNQRAADEGEWWSGSAEGFSKIQDDVKAFGLMPLSTPRIITSDGKEAQMRVGNETNHIEFDCVPVVNGSNLDLNVSGEVVDTQEGLAVTNQFKTEALVQSNGGMVIRAQKNGGPGGSNVVVLLTAKILSLKESAQFQQRLVRVTKPTATNDPASGSANGVMLYMRTFRMDTNVFLANLRQQPAAAGLDWSTNSAATARTALRQLFTDAGVDLKTPPGKSVYYNDRRGALFVTATEADLDEIERVLQKLLPPPPPQLHIKARYISVPRNRMAGLENFLHGLDPANGRFTEILTGTNMRAILKTLGAQKGVATLGEPEITLLSGRRAEMRTTWFVTVATNLTSDDQGAFVPQTADFEVGSILDVTPHVLGDGFTINLKAVPALTEFLGYRQPTESQLPEQTGQLPEVLPMLQTQKLRVEANLRDNQTLVLGGLTSRANQQPSVPKAGDVPVLGRLFQTNATFVTNDVLVFITATIVDPAGSRVHAEGELAPGQPEIPEQPATTNQGGVEFSTPEPAQLPGHAAVPQGDPGETDRLLQEGKKLYEGAMLNEAKTKFDEVIRSEPKNATALYYLGLIEQTQAQMSGATPVQRTFVLPAPNQYATNHLIFTGAGRQAIVAKLDKIHLDTVSYDGLPLNEVLKQLSEQCRLRDPERKGVNFLIYNGPDLSAAPAPAATSEQQDVGSYIIKIPSLSDVRLADVLDAIVLVSDHPLKYSIQDFAVVFSAKGPETPQLFMRTFRVDPNTFYSGLESVSAKSFGGVQSGGGGGGSQNNGAVVGVVNAFPGANSDLGPGGGGTGSGRSEQSLQGSSYVTTNSSATTPSALARTYFTSLGVNLNDPPGKSVYYNDQKGSLFVKATKADLDTIERALDVVNQTPPQIHIKARFYEVPAGALSGFGFARGQTSSQGKTNLTAATFTGVLTDANARVALRKLYEQPGVKPLGEPEFTTISGRQIQMRVTQAIEDGDAAKNATSTLAKPDDTGPALDVVPYVLADGYTINLAVIASGSVLPKFAVRQLVATANVWDNQTFVLELPEKSGGPGDQLSGATADKEMVIFVTATIIDAAGNRVHSDDELPFAQAGVPPKPVEVDQIPMH